MSYHLSGLGGPSLTLALNTSGSSVTQVATANSVVCNAPWGIRPDGACGPCQTGTSLVAGHCKPPQGAVAKAAPTWYSLIDGKTKLETGLPPLGWKPAPFKTLWGATILTWSPPTYASGTATAAFTNPAKAPLPGAMLIGRPATGPVVYFNPSLFAPQKDAAPVPVPVEAPSKAKYVVAGLVALAVAGGVAFLATRDKEAA